MYKLYLKYLRYRIKNCNTIDDYLKVIKNIDYFHKDVTSDKLCDIIIECLKLSPLTEQELQKISILQQKYDIENGLYNYISFIFWSCAIYYIQESHSQYNSKKYNDVSNNIDDSNIIDDFNSVIVISPWGNSYGLNFIYMIKNLYRLKYLFILL